MPVTCVFDGIISVQEPNDPKAKYREVINVRRADSTLIKLTFEKTEMTSDSLKVTLRAITTDSITATKLRLFLLIIQDSMSYGITGPLCFVARKIVPPDTIGFPFRHIAPFDTFDTTLTVPNIWNTTKLGVISFIQDISTKKIIQAIIKRKF